MARKVLMEKQAEEKRAFDAYMDEVRHAFGRLMDDMLSLDDIADYMYWDAWNDEVPAEECAQMAAENDDLCRAFMAEMAEF